MLSTASSSHPELTVYFGSPRSAKMFESIRFHVEWMASFAVSPINAEDFHMYPLCSSALCQ